MQDQSTLRRAAEASPHDPALWLLLGRDYLTRGQFRDARDAFEHALEIAPENAEATLGIAQVCYQQRRFSDAAVRTQSILQHHPHFAPALILLARIALAENSPVEALQHYRMALTLDRLAIDPALESDLNRRGFPVQESSHAASPQERGMLMASAASWEMDDPEILLSDPMDDEMSLLETDSFEGDALEQGEFPFVEDDELLFDMDEFERPKGSFADVAGLEEVKNELLMKLVYPYEYQDLFRAYGKKPGGSVLLYGPPGCGKSLVCRALAGESYAKFYSLKLHQILEMYIGCSEKNLNAFFEKARQNAPAVVFIDDLDGIGGDRAEMKNSPARAVVHQLLHELDGHDGANEGLLIIAATSAMWSVDPAFLRPGRFDRRIFVPAPDADARRQILQLLARTRPVIDLDFEALSAKTENYSGADIAQLFDVAAEEALLLAMRKKQVVPLTTESLESAMARVHPSVSSWQAYDQSRHNSA